MRKLMADFSRSERINIHDSMLKSLVIPGVGTFQLANKENSICPDAGKSVHEMNKPHLADTDKSEHSTQHAVTISESSADQSNASVNASLESPSDKSGSQNDCCGNSLRKEARRVPVRDQILQRYPYNSKGSQVCNS